MSFFHLFRALELYTYDLRFKFRFPPAVSDDIVIIEISDDTLSNLGKWPLPRDFHASLTDVLSEFGAHQVIFDVLFSEPALYDEVFAEAIKNSGNVYLAAAFYLTQAGGEKGPVADSSGVLADPVEALKINSKAVGHINVNIDIDGKARSIPLFVRFEDRIYPQMALKAACDRLGVNALNFEKVNGGILIDKRLFLPLACDGSFIVNYPGSWEGTFQHYSYFELLKAYSDLKNGVKPAIGLAGLKNKTCFIGLTATGTSDLQPVPLQNVYPLVGLQASVLNSILKKEFIIDAGVAVNAALGLLLFAVTLLICLRVSPIKAFFGIIAVVAGFFIISLILFNFGIWLALFNPLLIVVLTYISATLYRFLAEIKERQLLEKELEIAREIQKSFLPQEIVVNGGISISVYFEPAKFVAGDLYDVKPVSAEKIGIFLADVSGKGVPAALIMAQAISLFRIFSRQNEDCSGLLSRLNLELFSRLGGRFITAVYLAVDPLSGVSFLSSAGHLPVLFFDSRSGLVKELEGSSGLPLGIMEDALYGQEGFQLAKGDKIIIYTDGVSEARNKKNDEYGISRLKELVIKAGRSRAEELLKEIKQDLKGFTAEAKQHDDISLIVLEKK